MSSEIPSALKRIVEFLNERLSPTEVFAIELKQYTGRDTNGQLIQNLVPSLIGWTAEASAAKQVRVSQRNRWDGDSLLERMLERAGEAPARLAQQIFDWAENEGVSASYRSGKEASVYFTLDDLGGHWSEGRSAAPLSMWEVGDIVIEFKHMKMREPFNDVTKRSEWLNMLNQISGIEIPDRHVSRYVPISLSALDSHRVQQVLNVQSWVVRQAKADGTHQEIHIFVGPMEVKRIHGGPPAP